MGNFLLKSQPPVWRPLQIIELEGGAGDDAHGYIGATRVLKGSAKKKNVYTVCLSAKQIVGRPLYQIIWDCLK